MAKIIKRGLYSKWWVRTIRSINYFCFRRWWIYWIILMLIFLSAYLFCPNCSVYYVANCDCPVCDTIQPPVDSIQVPIDSIPAEKPPAVDTVPKAPDVNCRVHFSGVFMGGEAQGEVSKIYEEDKFSEFVGSGSYPSNERAFPKAVKTTFDGIAIDKGTRLVIYSKKNFKGKVLLDVTGPAIICNEKYRDYGPVNHVMTDVFPGDLQSNYPPSVRRYSNTDMHSWSFGSCRITCGQ